MEKNDEKLQEESNDNQQRAKYQKYILIGSAVLICALLVYLMHSISAANRKLYETQTADIVVAQDTVKAQAFVIRDEIYLNSENTNGTFVPLVSDGNRVARGDSIARVYSTDDDASSYAALIEARTELERYQGLAAQTQQSAVNIEKLNAEIDGNFAELVKAASTSDYKSMPSYIKTLEDKMASRQIIISGNSVNFDDKIAALNDRIKDLEAKHINPVEVKTNNSGYYISNIDGYENTVAYNNAIDMTVPQVEALFDAKPVEVTGKMGKLVGSYKWYIATVIDEKYYKIFTTEKSVITKKINIPYYGIKDVPVTVESFSKPKDGKIAVIFSCNLMNEVFANIRNFDIEIVMKEYEGYKIPATAQQTLEKGGKKFQVVYILRGNYMSARLIDVIFAPENEDYVIVSTKTEKDFYEMDIETATTSTTKEGETTAATTTTTTQPSDATDSSGKKKSAKEIAKENEKKAKTKVARFYINPISRYDEVIVKGKELEHGKSVG